jgi:hypothetical protein
MHVFVAALLSLLMMLPACIARAETSVQSSGDGPLAYVTVVGAPGDGEQALTAALAKELAARGLKPAEAFQANVYEVQGTVKLAPAGKGNQSVTIVWVVLGPDGTQLGITRQTKTVRQGSLDKRWGAAAQAAAAAAAADIARLIPR